MRELLVPAVGRGPAAPHLVRRLRDGRGAAHPGDVAGGARASWAQVDIVASDISDRALERARAGRFGRRALRQEVPAFAAGLLEVDERAASPVARRLTDAIQLAAAST